ncbi:ATP-binding protein [Thalassobacillus sp. CUG 92003]|uniref:ATP-binding protein n=1 Tax=Thalassobacillus sp. CUG 92003 TaxID=2736641 RepID=UPI0015E7BA22|nr:ATP-binding protein [Thalassobacillus sp. CUG 92003]
MVLHEGNALLIQEEEALKILELHHDPACIVNLHGEEVICNSSMMNVLNKETNSMSLQDWLNEFYSKDQSDVYHALYHISSQKDFKIKARFKYSSHPEFADCKFTHFSRGRIAAVFSMPKRTEQFHLTKSTPFKESVGAYHYSTAQLTLPYENSGQHYLFDYTNNNVNEVQYQLADMVEKFPHALAIISNDWEIVYANPEMESLTQKKLENHYKQKLWEVFPVEDYHELFRHYLRAMETKETVEFEGYLNQLGVHIQMTVHPTSDGLTIFARNLTSYYKQIQALKRSEERFSLLAHNIKEVFWITDPSFEKFHYISPPFEDMFHMHPNEIIEDPFLIYHLIHPEDRERVCEEVMLMQQRKHSIEYRIQTQNHQVKWIRTRGFPVNQEGHKYIIGIHEDVTHSREIESLELNSRQLQTITQMSAGIAHEIKNPLTAIKGFVQIGAANPDLRDNYNDIIINELSRIETIVNDFMMLSNPKSTIELQPIHLGEIVGYVLQLFKSVLEQNQMFVESYVSSSDAVIYTEPKRLKQILVNLIKNALESMGERGRLVIHAEQDNEGICLKVKDDGEGLTDEQMQKLGEPFFTTKKEGTGLGVMVTKKMVADLNGTINYESVIHKGTTVVVRLPLQHEGVCHE